MNGKSIVIHNTDFEYRNGSRNCEVVTTMGQEAKSTEHQTANNSPTMERVVDGQQKGEQTFIRTVNKVSAGCKRLQTRKNKDATSSHSAVQG
jgi:hypothetical protein